MQQPPSLFRSLNKTLILASVIPLLLFGIFILYSLLAGDTEEIKQKNQLLARVISGQVKAELSSPLAILDNLRDQLEKNPSPIPGEGLQHLLNQYVENQTYFDSIYLLSRKGRVTVVALSSQHAGLRENISNLEPAHLDFYQTAIRNGSSTWSDNFPSLVAGSPSLAICVPLLDGKAIIGNIRIDFLQALLQKTGGGQRVEISVLDHRGDVVAASGSYQAGLDANLSHLHLVQQGLKGHDGSALFASDGTSYLGSVSAIEGPGWLTLISQPMADAHQAVTHAALLFGIGLIGAVALAILLAYFKAREMARPFHELTRQAEMIAGGAYDLTETIPQHQEVASLFESFQAMAAGIQDRENALNRREQDYRSLAENLPAIVYRVLIQQDNHLILLNRYQEKLTGFSHEEMIEGGTRFYANRIHPEDFPRTRDQISAAVNRKQPYNIEYRFCHKDGSYRHFIERGMPIFDEQNELCCLDGVVFDNSEQHCAKEILLQTEKMMSVGSLAAGMAREINNPLAGIRMNVELINQHLNPEHAANGRRARECQTDLNKVTRFLQLSKIDNQLNAIEEAAGRTAKIVDSVLSFSHNKRESFSECQAIDLIEQALQLAEQNLDMKKGFDFRKIKINRNYAENIPEILCEPDQIQRVLLNILENGAQAMFQETAKLREPTFTIAARKNGDYLCLEISDTGPGMDESVRRRVFEPFYTTKEAGQGTGLGLSVSYFIISNNHRGTISVESTPGVGSTFSICLPYRFSESVDANQF